MSKKLKKRANRLVRKAENRALAIRVVVREYSDATQGSGAALTAQQSERHREIERAVARYNEVNKALKRLRNKIQTKSKGTGRPAARQLGGR